MGQDRFTSPRREMFGSARFRRGALLTTLCASLWASCAPQASPEPPASQEVEPDAAGADDVLSEDAEAEVSDAEASDAGGAGDVSPEEEVGPDAPDADVLPSGPWRSALFPEGWSPQDTDAQGRFLHDFSFAGYGAGQGEPRAPEDAPVFSVVEQGADPTGAADATDAIAATIARAEEAGGGVVQLPPGTYRVDGLLAVRASNVVLRGAGPGQSALRFTRHEGMTGRAHLSFQGRREITLELPLAADAPARADVVEVADAGELAVGDEVALGQFITPEFVEDHGMTGVWRAFNDQWQPFFLRTVVAIDREVTPHRVRLDVPLRSLVRTRDGASLRRITGALTGCGVESLGLANAVGWEQAWSQDRVHALSMTHVRDCWVRDVASVPTPHAPSEGPGSGAHLQSGGIYILGSRRVTVSDATMAYAQNRGGGGNGYLFEVSQSNEVLFRDCVGVAGRHNFIQNWGFGTSGVVWLRITSREGRALQSSSNNLGVVGVSEFHHSLATANLIDDSVLDDGWAALNRQEESTGAGHSATENVFWNVRGLGRVRSYQFGHGYIIGTAPELAVDTVPMEYPPEWEELLNQYAPWKGSAPDDFVEGLGRAEGLQPRSLYEAQRALRLGRP